MRHSPYATAVNVYAYTHDDGNGNGRSTLDEFPNSSPHPDGHNRTNDYTSYSLAHRNGRFPHPHICYCHS